MLPAYGDGARLVWLQSDLLKLTASTYNEISIASPWDEKSKTRKAWELVAQGSSENWSYSLGTTTGRNELGTQITFIDAWISYAFSEQTTFWFNFDRQTQEPAAGKTGDASSSIFQVQHKIDNHALALRYESVDGADDPMINIDGNYTGNVSVLSIADRVKLSENLSIALEVHHHMAQNKDYVDSSNKATKELTFFTVGALATF
ncbi:MAG: outer membrane beta-barrel protein [Bdellovibrionia bacterium]